LSLLNILLGILVLTILATVHELGHFVFARLARVPVEEFALGFGPAILSKRRGGTNYRLNIIPVLAYVKIKGMEPGDVTPDGFNAQRFWKRFLILAGGPLLNILLALLLFLFLFSFSSMPTTTIGEIMPSSPAEKSGILIGDEILAINGENVKTWEDIVRKISEQGEKPTLTFSLKRGTESLVITTTPTYLEEEKRYIVGIIPTLARRNFSQAVSSAFHYFGQVFLLIFSSLGMLFSGKAGISDFAGPVGIVQITAQQAQAGVLNLLGITGILSMALGAFNLIPFPALDGGHLLFLVVEGISGKKVSPKVQYALNTLGFLILLGFLLIVTWGDILRL
jgi:regulator of sigma E protease